MKKIRVKKVLYTMVTCLLIAAITVSCGGGARNPEPTPEPTPTPTLPPTPPPSTPPPTPTPPVLVEWDKNAPVEQLFFHEMIAYPEIGFPNRTDRYGIDDYMITVNEYKAILESLHQKNYIIVDLRDVWEEFTNENGQQRMRRSTLMIPEGKKPIVLSFDDLTFHQEPYNAFMHRHIIGSDGEVWAEGIDPNGNPIITQDLTSITILDKFVRENPDFSHNGAKGCIAQTGLYGVLGYQTQRGRDSAENGTEAFRLNRMSEIARVRPVIQRLNETGWYWASHSWGHIRFENASINLVRADAELWKNEVEPLVGPTKIMIYGFGSRLDGSDIFRQTPGPALRFYVEELGFRMFLSVGREPFARARTDIPAVMMDRMASDGITLRSVVQTGAYQRFLRFYDARDVFDPLRPDRETNWG